MKRMWLFRLLAGALVVVLVGGTAAAGVIGPGLDYMKTQPPSVWHLSVAEEGFGPGSDPFEGQVAVLTDTNVWRGAGLGPDQMEGSIPVEIVALSLHSVEPVLLTFHEGTEQHLCDVVVSLDPSTASTGAYLVTRDLGGGPDHGLVKGVPDSFFDVFCDFEFIPQDGSPSYHLAVEDHVVLMGDVPWSSMAPASYAHGMSGGFYPGFDARMADVLPLPPPGEPQSLVFQGQSFEWHLRLEPIPEPTTLGLLALGGLGLLRSRVRRKRSA